ncbi:OmpA family protein [Roseococcus sp. SYP-B2431]|uniref:OmpA family protein n=1 Tax=Roseococcus sp. SYP-B2431 TaxID=2496640 RepID=UPI00103E8B84|nr:OmpA family protein [Roseococcus sp. SYP-B2431]TCI00948.1 OmpA family protein [Roseococcus sp. SYP-B2431]
MKFAKLVVATSLMAVPALAQAQPITGLYIGVGAGASFPEEGRFLSNRSLAAGARAVGFPTTGSGAFETGFVGVGSIGWGFGFGLRAELEGQFRMHTPQGRGSVNGSGTSYNYGVMGNVLYDIALPFAPWVTPYVGAGVGYTWINADNTAAISPARGAGLVTNDTQGSFSYQAIAGLAFPVSAVPGLAVTMEYRYFHAEAAYFDSRAFATNNGSTFASGAVKTDFTAHSAMAGLRYAFNTPRPAPVVAAPVAAAPAPARTYLVFFDWDRADLTDRARQIIAEAATNARAVSATRIEVSGHADRTGTAQYNQRLSVRRAEAVAAELVRRGIARNEITIQGFGFDRPLVPTAMGVREPQNRRVEIVLR